METSRAEKTFCKIYNPHMFLSTDFCANLLINNGGKALHFLSKTIFKEDS